MLLKNIWKILLLLTSSLWCCGASFQQFKVDSFPFTPRTFKKISVHFFYIGLFLTLLSKFFFKTVINPQIIRYYRLEIQFGKVWRKGKSSTKLIIQRKNSSCPICLLQMFPSLWCWLKAFVLFCTRNHRQVLATKVAEQMTRKILHALTSWNFDTSNPVLRFSRKGKILSWIDISRHSGLDYLLSETWSRTIKLVPCFTTHKLKWWKQQFNFYRNTKLTLHGNFTCLSKLPDTFYKFSLGACKIL